MARGKKTGGRNFKEGNIANPHGAPRVPQDLKDARKLSKIQFEILVNKYLFNKKQDLAVAAANPETPVLELLIGSIIHKAVVEGDERRLNFLLDRLIGKVVDKVSNVDADGKAIQLPQVMIYLPDNGRNKKD